MLRSDLAETCRPHDRSGRTKCIPSRPWTAWPHR